MDVKLAYYILPYIVLLPLIGAAFAYMAGKREREAAGRIATYAAALAFVLTILAAADLMYHGVGENVIFNWFSVGALSVDVTLRFDQLTAVMCLVVSGVGSLIHLYSIAYMADDEDCPRFFGYLNLFLCSMLLLVMAGNLLVLFIGWEGVGLCSYLLIGFWHKNPAYAAAGMKAFVVNRIGDAGFLFGILLLLANFGSLDFAALKALIEAHPHNVPLLTLIALCLFAGAAGKSAQIPLFVWLPDAMAGPTPVSALIHAATMVTAGVYLMCRMYFLYALTPIALAVVCAVALLTAFVAATIAVVQNDIKKVLAYSTVSQLGFMFLAASVGAYWLAIFHLVTHAFFKACLFLGAGSVMRGCGHEQDMRRMGGLARRMPLTALTFAVAVLAIAGVFPWAGFQSKHAILHALGNAALPLFGPLAEYVPAAAAVTAVITSFYMTRCFAMTFLGRYRGQGEPRESPAGIRVPLIVLALLSTFGGLVLNVSLAQYLSPVLPIQGGEHFIEPWPESLANAREHLQQSWGAGAGIVLGLLLYSGFIPYIGALPGWLCRRLRPLSCLIEGRYFFDEIYQALIVRPLAWFARVLWKVVDQGGIDGVVNGTGAVVEFCGESLRLTQTGQVRHYAMYMLGGALFLIFFYLIWV